VEQVISFLMKNLGIVIIVVGVIYTLFFRKSPLERPPNRMPDFGGGGQQRPGQTGGSRPPVAEPRSPAPQRSAPPPAPRQQPARIETRQADPKSDQQRPMVLGHAGMDETALTRRQRPVVPANTRMDKAVLTRDDLSRAVMWAEILGPPRARRPHRR
jgi:hypothetical protein